MVPILESSNAIEIKSEITSFRVRHLSPYIYNQSVGQMITDQLGVTFGREEPRFLPPSPALRHWNVGPTAVCFRRRTDAPSGYSGITRFSRKLRWHEHWFLTIPPCAHFSITPGFHMAPERKIGPYTAILPPILTMSLYSTGTLRQGEYQSVTTVIKVDVIRWDLV